MATDRAEATRRGRSITHQAAYFAPDSKAGARMRGSLAGALQQYAEDVQSAALRGAVFAGAKVLSAELEVRVPVDKGVLKDAVYHWHDDKQSASGRQVYAVGVNKVKAPHWFVVEYGHWRYNRSGGGFWLKSKSRPNARGPGAHDLPSALPAPVWVPGQPYLRPTWDARAHDAIRAMQRRLVERLRELRTGAGGAPEADA